MGDDPTPTFEDLEIPQVFGGHCDEGFQRRHAQFSGQQSWIFGYGNVADPVGASDR